jgi:phospholipid/cholesterol/gamma-HCH transport system substrate-binding protein
MKRRDEVLVGILVLVATALLVYGTLWLARGGLRPGYQLYATFPWGAGLKQGQPVLLAGVNAGFVNDVVLRPDGRLVVQLQVQRKYQVPRTAFARIDPNGFFGDMLVSLNVAEPTGEHFVDGDTVPSVVAGSLVQGLAARADTIEGTLIRILDGVERDLMAAGTLKELRRTVDATTALLATLERTVTAQSAELSATQGAVRRTLAGLDSAQLDSAVRGVRGATAGATALTDSLRAATSRLSAVVAKLETTEGSAGRLLNDPGLYDDTRRLLTRLDSLTADFKKNPRKYIKFSIF